MGGTAQATPVLGQTPVTESLLIRGPVVGLQAASVAVAFGHVERGDAREVRLKGHLLVRSVVFRSSQWAGEGDRRGRVWRRGPATGFVGTSLKATGLRPTPRV